MILNNWIVSEKMEKTNQNVKFLYSPPSPIIIKKFNGFEHIASSTLKIINETDLAISETVEEENTNITRSDFHLSTEPDRDWVKNIEQYLASNLVEMCMSIEYMGFIMRSMWFQQYNNLSSHSWHLHQFSNYSGVFYLQFPEDGPKTEFYDFSTKRSVFLDMSEGDIAIFPSHLPHRSPKNNSKNKKTIISFNISFSFPLENHDYINNALEQRHG